MSILSKAIRIATAAAIALFALFAICGCGASETGGQGAAPAAFSAAGNTPSPSTTGALSVKGTQLVGESGEPVQLKGISTHGLAWFPQYVDKACFASLKEWGCSVVRLAMYTEEYGGYCSGGNQQELRDLVDRGVQYATDLDMYVIVDWHTLSDTDPNTHIADAEDFFTYASKRYAGHNNVIYEICNEPNGSTSWASVKSYAERIIPIIRANDPNAIIIVGTPTWSQRVDEAAADPITGYGNIMYTLHFYAATHKDDLRSKLITAHDAGLPIFVTEFGICDASGNGALDTASAQAWINLLDKYGISYIMWNLSNKAESSSVLLPTVSKTSNFTMADLSPAGTWLLALLGGELSTQDPDDADDPGQPSEQPSDPGQQTPPGGNADTEAVIAGPNGLSASIALKNSWNQEGKVCQQYELALVNLGPSAVDNWDIYVPFDGPVTLQSGWNGEFSANGNTLHITSKDYNSHVASNGTVSDIGFIVMVG